MMLMCVLFGVLGYRVYKVQVLQKDKLEDLVKRSQYFLRRLQAQRGNIYDRHLGALAMSVEVSSLGANPRALSQELRTAKLLSEALSLPAPEIFAKLTQDSYFVWLKRQLTDKEVKAISHLPFYKDLRIEKERQRVYPNGRLASHLLGGVGSDGKGLGAAELAMEPVLRGKTLSMRLMRDTKGRDLFRPSELELARKRGADLVLTLDMQLQDIAERAMDQAMERTKAKRGIAVVMEPHTGDILALVVKPDFDPNAFSQAKPAIRNNAALSNPYEPGSTLKVITVAAALEKGLTKLDERIPDDNGRMSIGRRTIRDDHPQRRPLTPHEIIKYSSNICTAKLAFRLGKERLYQALKDFGFGEKTDVGLPGESRGILNPPRRWADISLANIAFGQGISVTPIQLTAAINTLASDGLYYKPRIFKQLRTEQGQVIREFPATPIRRVVSKKVATQLRLMMESVVGEKGGTGRKAAIEGIRAGGKTGTAQKPIPGGRGYGKERIGSFVGIAPVDQPRLTVLVVIDEPKGIKYGGETAAPAWQQIVQDSLRHMGVLTGEPLTFAPITHILNAQESKTSHKPQESTSQKKASVKEKTVAKAKPSLKAKAVAKAKPSLKAKAVAKAKPSLKAKAVAKAKPSLKAKSASKAPVKVKAGQEGMEKRQAVLRRRKKERMIRPKPRRPALHVKKPRVTDDLDAYQP
jgi:cell division protein FtsI (penicillin-binding protein 3)